MTQQYHLPLPQKESMTLEDFLLSPSNEEAVHWLVQTQPEAWPSHALVLWGPEGSGKTHLMTVWQGRMGAQRVTPENEAVLSSEMKGAYVIDDADQVAGHEGAEEWLQHFYNASKAAHCPVLMTARTAPKAWGIKLPDILTRLKSSQTIALQEPDDELIHGLLLKLFQDRQLLVDVGVVNYIAPRLERTGTAVRRAVAKLDDAALEGRRKISIPFVQKTLGWGSQK